MKPFHVSVSVADLAQSIEFYNTLFGRDSTATAGRRRTDNRPANGRVLLRKFRQDLGERS
jgi:predicted enzyme related to lactoylglutathione lyase